MLKSKPTGANQEATEKWEASNRMTIEIFKAFWQKASPDLEFPWTQAGDEASYNNEWTDKYGCKCQGTREPGGAKHGIVRTIVNGNYGFIREATYYNDKPHGLSCYWNKIYPAFQANIFDHGEEKAVICWKGDWSEAYSKGDKELILMNNGLSIFKP